MQGPSDFLRKRKREALRFNGTLLFLRIEMLINAVRSIQDIQDIQVIKPVDLRRRQVWVVCNALSNLDNYR